MARAVEARAVGLETSAVIRARAQSAVVPSPSRLACAFIAIAMAAAAAARRTNYRHLAARAVSTAAVGEAGAYGAVAAGCSRRRSGTCCSRKCRGPSRAGKHAASSRYQTIRARTRTPRATTSTRHGRCTDLGRRRWRSLGRSSRPSTRRRRRDMRRDRGTGRKPKGARTLAEGAVRPSKAGAAHAAVIDASSIERAGAIAWARANGAIGAVVPWLAVARPVVAAPVVCAAVDARSQTAVMTGEAGRASRSYNDGAIDAGVAGCARAHPILAYSLGRALHSFGVRETKAQRKCTHVGRKEGE